MKFLALLLTTILSSSSFAGPGDNPIVPWPTNVNRKQIIAEDLQGSWVAFGDNTIWLVNIALDSSETNRINVSIKSNGLFSGSASGWMFQQKDLYWGAVRMDEERKSGVVIYRDDEGFKMRIYSRNLKTIYDLQLYPSN